MSNAPLMPMATAVWLVENTTLTFKQIADFCKLHEVEIQGIADGEVAKGIKAYNPIISGQLSREEIELSSKDENKYFFMEPKSFEQIEIKKDLVGEKGRLLTENLKVTVSFYNELPISVDLPNQVNCKVETTDAALKGQTVSSSYKPAILDNGLSVQVPPFIEAGDIIIVDTRNLEYVKKI